jgi:hypothetical protein
VPFEVHIPLSARHKLNVSYVNGILLVAGVIAALLASWPLFLVLAAIFAGLAIYAGDIRLRPRR